eukprot:102142-Amphidinium_carterae.1
MSNKSMWSCASKHVFDKLKSHTMTIKSVFPCNTQLSCASTVDSGKVVLFTVEVFEPDFDALMFRRKPTNS